MSLNEKLSWKGKSGWEVVAHVCVLHTGTFFLS